MGVVYACVDIVTGEKVALKLLHTADGTPLPGTAAWFWAEARALAYLDHPGIVRARDFGVLRNSAPFLAMDIAPGLSLVDLLADIDLSWPTIWLLTDQLLAALAHAHARGVIHGDLKHSNIMVEVRPNDVRVRVLDFGLAWLLRDRFDHRIDGTAREGPMVRPHAGTVGWMAPEQIRGAVPHVGPATDLYALGCVLFQLLTGSEPYESNDLEEIQRLHRNAPVPEVRLPEGVPEGVGPFVQRLIAKRPWQRFDFAADARQIFEAFRPAGPVTGWELPVPAREEDAPTLPPPPSRDTEIKPTFEIPITENSPPGLLGFGPARFVGREDLKVQLWEELQDLCEAELGTHRMVLLTGSAGVGKSHLAEWLCEDAHERAVAIPLRARHNKIPTPFDGIVGAVTGYLGLENADRVTIERVLMNTWEVRKDDDDGLQWVAAVGEWLRPTPPGQRVDPGPTGKRFVINSRQIRWAIVRYVLTRLGRGRPLLLWLDDLHMASTRDFAWIEQLRERPLPIRVMLLATTPTRGPESSPVQQPRILDLVDRFGARTIEVEPFSASEMRELLLSSAALDEGVIDLAYRRSRGIPLFALQLVHAWANGGSLEMRSGRYHVKGVVEDQVPSTTATLWDERLSALPEEALKAAMAASALGGEVRSEVLVPLLTSLGLPAFATLSMLEQTQLLTKVGKDRYRWPHALLQEHLLTKLSSTPEAPRVLREAAFALASYHPAAGTRRIVRHRVTNLIRAKEEGEAVRVMIDFVARSWERTRDVNATISDLKLIEGLPRGAWAAMHKRWMAEALRHSGQLEEATNLAFGARRAFSSLNDPYNEAQCLRLLGHIASEKGAPRDGRKMVAEARTMMNRLQDAWGRAQCDVVLGELDYLLGDHELARQELEQAIAPLEQAQDVLGRGQCQILLALIELGTNDCNSSRRHLISARQGFDRIGYRLGTAQCDVALAHADHRSGEVESARARGQNALSSFRLLGTPRGQTAALRVMAMAALDAGDLNDAEARAKEALALFEQIGDPWGLAESGLLVAQVALARGAPEARDLVNAIDIESVQEREPLQHWHLTKAWLAARDGLFEEAADHLEKAKETLSDGRLGDHALQLSARVSALPWPEAYKERVQHALLKDERV
jgi:serine/threonine protein kinase/tetratricopeptide (TPR) repeat protein